MKTRENYIHHDLKNELADEHCHVETVEKLIGDINWDFAPIGNFKTVQSEKTVYLPIGSRTGVFYYTEFKHEEITTAFTNNFSMN